MHEPWPVLLMARELGAGGSERQLAETARSLDPAEFEVHVACFRPGGIRWQELEASGVALLPLPVWSLYKRSAFRGARTLRRYLREHSIRLVHTFDSPTNVFGVPVARLAGTPVVLSSQRAFRELTPPLHRAFLRVTDRMVDGIVVNCEAVARHLTGDEGIPAARVLLCYNGIDTAVFHPGPVARKAAVADAAFVAGTVCALREEKRLDLLIEAFAGIAAPGRKLVVVGSGPELERMEAVSRRLSVRDACHFEPLTQDVAGWLHSMDVFVLPSRSEALSNSLAEAMACGCAVIASDVGGNPELVSGGETGLLFRNGDLNGLREALARLAEDAGLRARLGAAGAARIGTRFSRETAAKRMAEIYRTRLLEAARKSPA